MAIRKHDKISKILQYDRELEKIEKIFCDDELEIQCYHTNIFQSGNRALEQKKNGNARNNIF